MGTYVIGDLVARIFSRSMCDPYCRSCCSVCFVHGMAMAFVVPYDGKPGMGVTSKVDPM